MRHHKLQRRRPAPRTDAELADLIERLCILKPIDVPLNLAGADADATVKLFLNGQQLDAKMRREVLEEIEEGEMVPAVEFEAATYIQRPTPNRNYVRFKNGILSSFAKSYKSAVFLKNHDTYDIDSRSGTVTASSAEKNADETRFIMRVMTAPNPSGLNWGALGVLNGTIDRFSIGWAPGPMSTIECSVHKAPVFTECDCYPGEKIGDEVVEFVFTVAQGTEVSAVNIPAVVGTGISTISRLNALDRAHVKRILGASPQPPQPEQPAPSNKEVTTMDPQLLALLGLAPTATKAEVDAAFALHLAKQAEQKNALAAAQAELALRESAERKVVIDTAISSLCASGKIQPGGSVELALRAMADGGPSVAAITDPVLRSQSQRACLDLFCSQVKALKEAPSVTPAGAGLPGASRDPLPAAPPAPEPGQVLDAKGFLAASKGLGSWLNKAGITHEQFEKHGQLGREFGPQMFNAR